eukprot:9493591-Pyramimonas_sp.AAC.1
MFPLPPPPPPARASCLIRAVAPKLNGQRGVPRACSTPHSTAVRLMGNEYIRLTMRRDSDFSFNCPPLARF